MLARKDERMTVAEFLAWEELQEEKWELVDGVPELRSDRKWPDRPQAMAGARRAHNQVVANLLRHLGNRLAGGPCRPFPSDLKVSSPTGNVRYPDVVVDCGPMLPDDLEAAGPRVLFEVLSPSNRPGRQLQLMDDYRALASLECFVLIEPDEVYVSVYTRGERFWPSRTLRVLSGIIQLPMLGIELPLTEVYEYLGFEPRA